MDLSTFQKMCMAHIDAAKEKLLKKLMHSQVNVKKRGGLVQILWKSK